MKLETFLACVFFLSATAYAQNDKNCEAAVDAAASMNLNQPECDYSDKGLNGYLHKAFKKGENGATLNTNENKDTADNDVQQHEKKSGKNKQEKSDTKNFLLNAYAAQWADTSAVRTQLLSKAMEKCGTGFSVKEEIYRAVATDRLQLTMRFECLND